MVEYLKCSKNKMEDPNYALYLIDDPELEDKKMEYGVCSTDYIVSEPFCYKKCGVNYYNIGIKFNFLRNYKQALKSNKF